MALNTKIRGTQLNDAIAGNGLTKDGSDNLQVNVDDSSIEITTDALNIKALGITNAMLGGSIADSKLASDYIQTTEVDDSSIEFAGSTLNVKALGVTNAMLAGSITDAKLDSDYIQTSEVDGTTIEFGGGTLNIVANGIGASEIDETDNYSFSGTFALSTAPTIGNSVVNKTYVDNLVNGLQWKDPVRVKGTVSDGNITLSGVSGQSLDSVSVVADDRVLLTEQTSAIENGIWIVKSGAWTRPTDFPNGGDAVNATCLVSEGTDNADTQWTCTSNADADTIDTDTLEFTQISGTGSITAGDGLTKSGNTLDVNVDDSSIEINADTLRVKASGITNAMLGGSIADGKLASDYIQTSEVDGTTIEFSGGTLNIVANGVGTTQLATDSVDKTIINADIAGLGLSQAVGGELDVNVDDSSIEISTDTLQVKALGITNAMLGGSIADSKLASDYIQTTEVDDSSIEFAGSTLNVKALGVTNAMLAGSIAEGKLAIFNGPTIGEVLGFTANGMEWVSGTVGNVNEADIQVENESANCNGATTAFSLSSTPITNSLQVFLNGLLQENGSGKDYTVSGTTVTFADAPLTGDILLIHYTIDN